MARKTKQPALMNPVIGGLPDDLKPAYNLTITQKEHFDEIVRELHRNEMLSSVDRFQITHAAVILDKMIQAKVLLDSSGLIQTFETGASNISAELTAFKSLHGEWEKCVMQLGLSPKARNLIMKKPSGKAKQPAQDQARPGLAIPR
jgi:P27 family predicted phage terminase small subunit